MNEGWIRLHRKLLDNPIYSKLDYLGLWCFLLLLANHKYKEIILDGKKTTIKRGQLLTSISKISDRFGISKSKTTFVLNYFKVERMIERSSTNKYTIITIENYCRYQDVERAVGNKSETNRKQIGTNNNDNNDNTNTTSVVLRENTPLVYGDKKVKILLEEFEKRFGFPPTDSRPRFAAWNLARRIDAFIKSRRKDPNEYFDRAVKFLFDKIQDQDWSDRIQKIDTIRLKSVMFLKGGTDGQPAKVGGN